jgi:hypothetical protein
LPHMTQRVCLMDKRGYRLLDVTTCMMELQNAMRSADDKLHAETFSGIDVLISDELCNCEELEAADIAGVLE